MSKLLLKLFKSLVDKVYKVVQYLHNQEIKYCKKRIKELKNQSYNMRQKIMEMEKEINELSYQYNDNFN